MSVAWVSTDLYMNIGWLMSETLRKLSEHHDFDKSTQIIGLRGRGGAVSECYDLLLMDFDASIHFIQNGD